MKPKRYCIKRPFAKVDAFVGLVDLFCVYYQVLPRMTFPHRVAKYDVKGLVSIPGSWMINNDGIIIQQKSFDGKLL